MSNSILNSIIPEVKVIIEENDLHQKILDFFNNKYQNEQKTTNGGILLLQKSNVYAGRVILQNPSDKYYNLLLLSNFT